MTPSLHDRLLAACVGGCSCMTKTPVIEHHDEACHYRLFTEAANAISDERSRAQDAVQRGLAMYDALYRLRKWDMLDHTADGPYWKTVIDAALEEATK